MAQKSLILAIETSGRDGSIALARGTAMLEQTLFSKPMRHNAEIFPAAKDLLARFKQKPDAIQHIYISVGPGSFTGLRIATAFAKIMHLANNKVKIVAVDTMDVIAANADEFLNVKEITTIATILDAKRNQFFTSVYRNEQNQWTKILPNCLMKAEEFVEKFADSKQPIWLLGEGLVYYRDNFKVDGIKFLDEKYWKPKAENVHKIGWQMAQQGQFTDALNLHPDYLRRAVIEKNLKTN